MPYNLHETSPTAMAASGMLFLGKRGATAGHLADGTFYLLMFAHDRISAHRLEPWLLRWDGPEAEAFWQAHRADLTPGTPLNIKATRLRTFVTAGHGQSPEVHAVVLACALAPLRHIDHHQYTPARHVATSHTARHHSH